MSADSPEQNARDFHTTRWSIVLKAGGAGEEAGTALEKLCRAYHYPLYLFVRQRGHEAAEAQDLTQEFFARLLAGRSLQMVQPEKGRFRTFLLTALRNFLANAWRDANCQKRGGGAEVLSWDHLEAEERFKLEPAVPGDEEAMFDRRWACEVVSAALKQVQQEMEAEGTGDRFVALHGFLQGEGDASYAAAAQQLGMSESAVKSAIFRMRRRYGECIRREIEETVGDPEEVEAEIRYLISIIARG
jgi:RNA polymerase sigma-70 factor (ECF subfamily)